MGQERSELHDNDIEHNDVAKGHDNSSENNHSEDNGSCACHHACHHINVGCGLRLTRHHDRTLKDITKQRRSLLRRIQVELQVLTGLTGNRHVNL